MTFKIGDVVQTEGGPKMVIRSFEDDGKVARCLGIRADGDFIAYFPVEELLTYTEGSEVLGSTLYPSARKRVYLA